MNKALVYAKSKYVRTSVKKTRPVLDLVRGKDVNEAKKILRFHPAKPAKLLLKTLNSAVSNARHNLDLNEKNLYISELYVNEGPTMKHGQFVGRGRFNPILKRTSHIVVGLSERDKK